MILSIEAYIYKLSDKCLQFFYTIYLLAFMLLILINNIDI